MTVIGNIRPIGQSETAAVRKLYLASYGNSKYWVDYEDFSFYRMEVVDVYYVGGFGVMGWVAASDYNRVQPDPLVDAADEIIQHMNADHLVEMVQRARHGKLKTSSSMRGVE